jgi:hypothetical protein
MWVGWIVFGIIVGLPIVLGIVGVILFILSEISGLSPMTISFMAKEGTCIQALTIKDLQKT